MKEGNLPRAAVAATALLASLTSACSAEWPAFRHDLLRWGAQINESPLSDPAQVPGLAVRWTFTGGTGGYRASPIVYKDRVYIGAGNGRFYAIDVATGNQAWQYPPATQPALTTQFSCNPSSYGIAASAVIGQVGSTDAVIFGAPDPTLGTRLGEGRLFALNAETGAVLWRSPVIARLTGLGDGSTSEFHEQMGYSSPLVYGDKVYVGVGDHCDNPIQKGRVVAVNMADGTIASGFSFCSTGTCPSYGTGGWAGGNAARGGGVWSSQATWNGFLYVTTGNTQSGATTEPSPNHGLSLLKLDKDTGALIWKFQPVSWALDNDPDWSAAPTVMLASCGTLIVSTQKDGYTHALNADQPSATASARWTYPPATLPFTSGYHGDTRYMRSGAAWDDVYITMNGGLNLPVTGELPGERRLHAFNVCASNAERLRWIVDVPGTSKDRYALGNPVVTRGVVYVGTDQGHVVAIADPRIYPSAGWRCSNPEIPTTTCVSAGYTLVPQPAILKDLALESDDRMVYTEPVLAKGKLFVATEGGRVYMLSP